MSKYNTNLYEKPLMLWSVLPNRNNSIDKPIASHVSTRREPPISESEDYEESDSEMDSDYTMDEAEDDFSSSESDLSEDLCDEIEAVDIFGEVNLASSLDSNNSSSTNDTEEDSSIWGSSQEKIEWLRKFNDMNLQWIHEFGCRVDTDAVPEVYALRHGTKKPKPNSIIFKIIWVIVIIAAYAFQWNIVFSNFDFHAIMGYANSSSTIKPVTNNLTGNSLIENCFQHTKTMVLNRQNIELPSIAKRICNEAVEKQSTSMEKSLAMVQRGDLLCLLSDIDGALENYQVAYDLYPDSPTREKIYQKLMRTMWLSLYKQRQLEALYLSCTTFRENNQAPVLQEESTSWIDLLQGKGSIRDILIQFKVSSMTRTS